MDEIEQIKQALAALETQRNVLGDEVVETALAPLRQKLASLQPGPTAEQRKLVTVLFADLVGFTALSAKMDPEDVHEIINAYFTRWTACIEEAGGVVEKFIGDAVMAVFGLMVTREDDPEKAVRAALAMKLKLVELIQETSVSWNVELAMRVGIHTGPVLVSFLGERKGQEFVAVGDTVNLASRLQSAAQPGSIVISQGTYKHIRGLFEVQKLAPLSVKGKEEPVQAYQVLQARRHSFNPLCRGVEGIQTHMIGREPELAQLRDGLLATLQDRKARGMILAGEAGIGKSRLINEFDNWVEQLPENIRYFKGRSSPSMQNLSYSLLRDLFAYRFQIYDNDSPQVVQQKFEQGIGEFEYGERGRLPTSTIGDLSENDLPSEAQRRAHFIGRFLGYGFENSSHPGNTLIDPQSLRDLALGYLVDYFKALASVRPVIIMLEDIHWADDSSLSILGQLLEKMPAERMFWVCTARPSLFERFPEWGRQKSGSRTDIRLVDLKPLSLADSQGLVNEILQKVEDIPESLHELVVQRAEGNPFYLEELIKMLIEAAVILKSNEDRWRVDLTHLASVQVPTTLTEVLQARFDSLNVEERVLLQRASVLGRIFWDKGIAFMEKNHDDQVQVMPDLEEFLLDLNAREMVFTNQVSTFDDTREYYFKHSLLRDVTYESVLKRLRKIYHAYAAAWLETVTEQSRRAGEYAALIAEHYDRADDRAKARSWYQRAGLQAIDHYANSEGIHCLTRCLELWPEEDASARFDLTLKRAKLYDVIANRPAQKQDLERLQALAEKLDDQLIAGDQPQVSRQAQAFLQWWNFHDAVGDFKASTAASQWAIDLAHASGDRESEALGNLYLGATLWRQSDYRASEERMVKALALAREIGSRKIEADCLRNLGIALQYQGKYPEARARYQEALRLYKEIDDERGESMALNSLGSLMVEMGLFREALPLFERSLELKRKIGHRRAEHVTLHNLGLVAYKLGNYVQASSYLKEVQQFGAEEGDREGEADALAGLGRVALLMGNYPEAKNCLERSLDLAREMGLQTTECDSLILLGLLSYRLGTASIAYQYSQEALSLARRSGALDQQIEGLRFAGDFLLGSGRLAEAEASYLEALKLTTQGVHQHRVAEIQAGLARAYQAQGDMEQASRMLEAILADLAVERWMGPDGGIEMPYTPLEGMEEPFLVLLTCCQVLQAKNDPRGRPLLEAAYRLLLEQSDRLGNDTLKVEFLGNIPAHQEIITEWLALAEK